MSASRQNRISLRWQTGTLLFLAGCASVYVFLAGRVRGINPRTPEPLAGSVVLSETPRSPEVQATDYPPPSTPGLSRSGHTPQGVSSERFFASQSSSAPALPPTKGHRAVPPGSTDALSLVCSDVTVSEQEMPLGFGSTRENDPFIFPAVRFFRPGVAPRRGVDPNVRFELSTSTMKCQVCSEPLF